MTIRALMKRQASRKLRISFELVVTCKVGSNEYKKNYIYLNDYTLYVIEDITGTHADPYHYIVEFHTEFPVDVDVKP